MNGKLSVELGEFDPTLYQDSLLLEGVKFSPENILSCQITSLYLGNYKALPSVSKLLEQVKCTKEQYLEIVNAMLMCIGLSNVFILDNSSAHAFVEIISNFKRQGEDFDSFQEKEFERIVRCTPTLKDFLINPNNSQVIPFRSNYLRALLPELWQIHHQLKYLVDYMARDDIDDRRKAYSIAFFCSGNEADLIEISKKARLDLLKDLLKIRKWIAKRARETSNCDDRITYISAYGKILRILQLYFSKSTKKLDKYTVELTELYNELGPHYSSDLGNALPNASGEALEI